MAICRMQSKDCLLPPFLSFKVEPSPKLKTPLADHVIGVLGQLGSLGISDLIVLK